jgi:hypothetical protein
MARHTIYDQPMSPAERMRRYRARKKLWPIQPKTRDEALLPVKKFARFLRVSERQYFYHCVFRDHSLIKWGDELLNGKYGKVGIHFLAEVCKHGDASAQRAIRNRIRKAGAAAGRELWLVLCREARPDLIRR